ncbi:MAG: pantetheine-phosphate adenylyltransferase [Chloroflexi bacterium]|nr:pantetheine-phosphate adenylyltransferase [Chloroflexota bacterium]
MAKAVYPGSFDPVHNGHLDVTERASRLFDTIIVGVYDSPPKNLMFSTDERVEMFKEGIKHVPNVEVRTFTGLAVDFARTCKAEFILRGLRAGSDFEVEFEMAHMWRKLAPDIDVVCMMSALEHQFIHSSRIKEVAKLGGDVAGLVSKHVASAIKAKVKSLQ